MEAKMKSIHSLKLRPKIITLSLILACVLTLGLGFNVLFAGRVTNTSSNPQFPIPQALSPTSLVDPTADWSTYTNSAYGYIVKYPPTWKTEVFIDNVGKPEGELSYVTQQGVELYDSKGRGLGLVYLRVFRNSSSLPVLNWLNTIYIQVSKYENNRTSERALIPNKINDTVDGKPAVRVDIPAGQSSASIVKYIEYNKYIYQFTFFLQTPNLYDHVYAPMLSSFHFVN